VDLQAIESVKSAGGDQMPLLVGSRLGVGDLPPGSSSFEPNRTVIPIKGKIRWNIFFDAKNGFWDQALRCELINGDMVCASRVSQSRGKTDTVLLEQVDPRYPKNSDGKVDW
jgi:hypothetical protein